MSSAGSWRAPLAPRVERLGFFSILAIIFLRLVIGYHFYKEGIAKLKDDGFRSKYFLQQATGPLADTFHRLVPDRFGELRLDKSRTVKSWETFHAKAVEKLRLDEANRKKAKGLLDSYKRKLGSYLAENAEEIQNHRLEVQRLKVALRDDDTAGIEFQRNWISQQEYELQQKANGWIKGVEGLQRNFQDDLLALGGDAAQRVHRLSDSSQKNWVDHAVTWVVLGVGVLLLLGLFVPLASMVGAGFLLSVIATQPFWAPDANLSYAYYQLVEIAALLLLAAWGAGQFAGLDYFTRSMWSRARGSNEVASQ